MACKHLFEKWNDVIFCWKCGLTFAEGKPIFDRKIHNYLEKKKKGCKKNAGNKTK